MKTYLVIGLGRFGSAAAEELFDMGEEVIVLDEQEEVVRQMADQATHAAIGDAREPAVLKAAGAMDCDCAIVAIGSDLAASILITMNLKDMGYRSTHHIAGGIYGEGHIGYPLHFRISSRRRIRWFYGRNHRWCRHWHPGTFTRTAATATSFPRTCTGTSACSFPAPITTTAAGAGSAAVGR